MSQLDEITQSARKKAEKTIDAALGDLHKAAEKIGKERGIPENIAGHSINELLGRMAYVPSMARDLRRVCAQELAKLYIDELLTSNPAPAIPSPVPTPEVARVEPSKIPDQVPVGRDVSDLSGVTVQTVKALKEAGLHTVGDVVAVPDAHLVKIPGIAEKSVQQIRAAIVKAST